ARASVSPRTAASGRVCRTRSSTPGPSTPRCSSATATGTSRSPSATTAAAEATATAVGTGSSGCASACPCTAASSTRARASRAVTPCARGSPSSKRTGLALVRLNPPGVELPTGTVTFLFSDVEGSTALLRRLKDGFAPVLSQQERLLREAAETAGGQEFGTQGDASFFVFRNPKD